MCVVERGLAHDLHILDAMHVLPSRDVEQCGFTSSVGTQEQAPCALGKVEIHALEYGRVGYILVGVPKGKIIDSDHAL